MIRKLQDDDLDDAPREYRKNWKKGKSGGSRTQFEHSIISLIITPTFTIHSGLTTTLPLLSILSVPS